MKLTLRGYRFLVNPETINRNLFQNERQDKKQEKARLLILEAFAEVDNNPEKYARAFEIIIPHRRKKWCGKTIAECKKLVAKIGDRMANWVEHVLMWAQRINDGEPWENVCNKPDTINWYRLVIWKDDIVQFVGGCAMEKKCVFMGHLLKGVESTFVGGCYFPEDYILGPSDRFVPEIVRYI